MVKPYFEKYEDHIDDGINKVTNDAQAVAIQNFQGLAWHVFMKTDRIVLDALGQIMKYIINFDPGTKRQENKASEEVQNAEKKEEGKEEENERKTASKDCQQLRMHQNDIDVATVDNDDSDDISNSADDKGLHSTFNKKSTAIFA